MVNFCPIIAAGANTFPSVEIPMKLKPIMAKKIIGVKRAKSSYFRSASPFKNDATIREPSKGGSGIRLKTPNKKFIKIE